MLLNHEVSMNVCAVMYFKVICVAFIGVISSVAARDKLHTKVHLPDLLRQQYHNKYVFLDTPKNEKSSEFYYDTSNPYEFDHQDLTAKSYVAPNDFHYQNEYAYTPNARTITVNPATQYSSQNTYKPKSAKSQKKQPSPGYHYSNSNPYVYEPYTGGYQQSWKTLRSEKYETETVDNPDSSDPSNKYIVKGVYKVREKLPYIDTTIGYDQEYEYPLGDIDHEYHKNEKIVDSNNAKTDPFATQRYAVPVTTQPIEGKKPKNYNYYYKYPSNDYEYSKNVQLVDLYINSNQKDNPDKKAKLKEEQYVSDEFDYSKNDFEEPKTSEYKVLDFDHLSSSEDDNYQKYKTDGPDYGYF